MIGIYKYTNKSNGKCYIGQSIHCGKRFDEHYAGSQYIDQILREEGIDNFTYEILTECNKNELDYWEDYYIAKYNSMYPNGYNKRWNCSKFPRKIFSEQLNKSMSYLKEEQKEYIQIITHIIPTQAGPYSKLNNNQWGVYFYLLFLSNFNPIKEEKYRYVYKSEISPTKIAKAFGFQPRTYYNIIKALQGKGLLSDQPKYFLLPLPEAYTTIPRPLLSQLLAYRERMTIDLLRTYLICRAIYDKYGSSKAISIRNIVGCLGHSLGRSEYYRTVELSLDLLINWGLVKYRTEWREDEKIGKYRVYRIYDILDESPELNFRGLEEHALSGNGDLSKEEEEHIKKIIGENFY